MSATIPATILIPSEASFGTDDYLPASDLEHLAARLATRLEELTRQVGAVETTIALLSR